MIKVEFHFMGGERSPEFSELQVAPRRGEKVTLNTDDFQVTDVQYIISEDGVVIIVWLEELS